MAFDFKGLVHNLGAFLDGDADHPNTKRAVDILTKGAKVAPKGSDTKEQVDVLHQALNLLSAAAPVLPPQVAIGVKVLEGIATPEVTP